MAQHTREFEQKENEVRLRAVLDNVLDGIVTIGEGGDIFSFNRAAERIFGYSAREVMGRNVKMLMPEPYHGEHDGYLRNYAGSGQAKIIGIGREVVGRRKDGTVFPMELAVSEMQVGETRMFAGIVRDISQRKQAEDKLRRSYRLLDAIRRAKSQLIGETSPFAIFDALLAEMLAITESAYGFIGEVLYTEAGQPYLKTFAITNVAWDEATRAFYQEHAPQGMEFRNLHTLFGAALVSGAPVIANDAANDPRRGGVPPGHPPLNAFMGLPFHHGGRLMGMIGLANRRGGYDQEMVDFLQPLLATCGNLIYSIRAHAERERAQQALRDSEERYRLMAEYSSDIIARVSPDGLFRYVSPASAMVLGYEPGDVEGRALVEFVHADDLERVNEAFQSVLQHYAMHTLTYRVKGKEGEWMWVETSLRGLRDGSARAAEIITVTREVTERVLAVQDLNRFKNVLDNTLDMLFMFEPDSLRFVYLNKGAAENMGYSAEELLQMTPDQIKPLISASEFRRLIAPLLSGEQPSLNFETLHRRKDGSDFPVEIFLQYVHEAEGRGRFIAIVRDITERRKVDRLKNEFVSTVSHELRTPLTSIRGALGLAVGGAVGALPAQAESLIHIAHKNSERLVRLINDILDIEKIESGKMHFEMAPHPLMPLIEQALEANQAYGEQYGVSFRIVSPVPEVRVKVDGDRLIQVMSNLLSNAAKFSPSGTAVEIAVSQGEDTVRVAVTDHGPGIPADFHDKIFQKFCQADASDTRQKGGTGLGLNITQAIVERMGGRIGFVSEPGAGAVFHFELPRWGEETAATAPPEHGRADAQRVLVCEDDPDIAALLDLTLANAGFCPDIAAGAAQAKRLLGEHRYAAMTLDIGLPDQDGISLLRELRAAAATRDLPVVVVSARAMEGRAQINGSFQLLDWIVKPFDHARLVSLVRRAVRGSGEEKARILHVEDDADIRQVVATVAQDVASFDYAGDVQEAAAKLALGRYHLVILDLGLPGASGWELLPMLKKLKPQPPVLVFSAGSVAGEEAQGVAAALVKSRTSNQELLQTIGSLLRQSVAPAEEHNSHMTEED